MRNLPWKGLKQHRAIDGSQCFIDVTMRNLPWKGLKRLVPLREKWNRMSHNEEFTLEGIETIMLSRCPKLIFVSHNTASALKGIETSQWYYR